MAFPVIGRIRSNAVIAEDIDAAIQEIATVCNGGLDSQNLARGTTFARSYFNEGQALITLTGTWIANATTCAISGFPTGYGTRLIPIRLQATIFNSNVVPTAPTVTFKYRDIGGISTGTIGTVSADKVKLKAIPSGSTAFIGVNEQPNSTNIPSPATIYATMTTGPTERSFVTLVCRYIHM